MQLFPQRGAMQTQQRGGTAFIPFAITKYFKQKGNLHLTQDDFVNIIGIASIKVAQIAADRLRDVFA